MLFLHEGYYVAFLGLLAVSNGYLTTISFMFGPKVKKILEFDRIRAFLRSASTKMKCKIYPSKVT